MNSLEHDLKNQGESANCDLCGHRARKDLSFTFRKPRADDSSEAEPTIKCFKCALKHLPLLRRSLVVALFVGTILTVLNQGGAVLSGTGSSSLYWKIPLTYCVPFCVATYAALSNVRQ